MPSIPVRTLDVKTEIPKFFIGSTQIPGQEQDLDLILNSPSINKTRKILALAAFCSLKLKVMFNKTKILTKHEILETLTHMHLDGLVTSVDIINVESVGYLKPEMYTRIKQYRDAKLHLREPSTLKYFRSIEIARENQIKLSTKPAFDEDGNLIKSQSHADTESTLIAKTNQVSQNKKYSGQYKPTRPEDASPDISAHKYPPQPERPEVTAALEAVSKILETK